MLCCAICTHYALLPASQNIINLSTIQLGRERSNLHHHVKPLLCAVYLDVQPTHSDRSSVLTSSSPSNYFRILSLLRENIVATSHLCDWAVVSTRAELAKPPPELPEVTYYISAPTGVKLPHHKSSLFFLLHNISNSYHRLWLLNQVLLSNLIFCIHT